MTTDLPVDLWIQPLELGSNARGIFVAWFDNGKQTLHVRDLSGANHQTAHAPLNSQFRAASGAGGTACAVAVQPPSGDVYVEQFANCP